MTSDQSPTRRPLDLYVERRVADNASARRIIEAFGDVPLTWIDDCRRIQSEGDSPDERIRWGKRRLAIGRKDGELVKPYPMSSGALTANEYYIVHGHNCPCDCEYCFLQAYLEHSVPTIYVNRGEILDAIRATTHSTPPGAVFHTGELSESLAWDEVTKLSAQLIDLFRTLGDATLELRTKLTDVDCLLSTTPADNVVLAWTISPPSIHRAYERGTPSPLNRIEAARKCRDAGYRVGFRLDPTIRAADWASGYDELIGAVYDMFPAGEIDSFVLGAFRYPRALEHVARARRPRSRLFLDEFVRGLNGKFRYFRPLRQEMYRHAVDSIRRRDPRVGIRLCMESNEVRECVGV